MADLLKQLRVPFPLEVGHARRLCREAADEIERLLTLMQTVLTTLDDNNHPVLQHVNQHRSELHFETEGRLRTMRLSRSDAELLGAILEARYERS